jgi:chemotaxis protein methyltransferase CheR
MGLFFPPERWTDLERKLQAAAPAFGCTDAEACARFLTTTPITKPQLDLLAIHLTVGETYFFREPRSLEVLERQILPELLYERRGANQQLRFWSAACCTGEEPYSIAILLHRLIPDLPTWRTTILATDISPRFLRKAIDGVYGQWSFRSMPPTLREQYFNRTPGGHYAILSALKQMVKFAQLNLVEDIYPSPVNDTADMDVIFCRNVLIYFTAERTKRILDQFYHALTDGGWLIVSPVETAFAMNSLFTPVQLPGVTLFRKDTHRQASSFVFTPFSSSPQTGHTENLTATLTANGPLLDATPGASAVDREDALSPLPASQETQPASPPTPEAPVSPYEEACELYAHGKYAETIEKLLTNYGTEERGALPSFRPPREQIMALLARAHANQGRLVEAQSWCEQALAANKCDSGLHYLRATILLECGQEAEARLSLTRALYLDQRFVLAHFALGNMARQRKELKEAGKHFQNALTLLHHYQPEDILPESEGMSAGRLAQIIADMSERL